MKATKHVLNNYIIFSTTWLQIERQAWTVSNFHTWQFSSTEVNVLFVQLGGHNFSQHTSCRETELLQQIEQSLTWLFKFYFVFFQNLFFSRNLLLCCTSRYFSQFRVEKKWAFSSLWDSSTCLTEMKMSDTSLVSHCLC